MRTLQQKVPGKVDNLRDGIAVGGVPSSRERPSECRGAGMCVRTHAAHLLPPCGDQSAGQCLEDILGCGKKGTVGYLPPAIVGPLPVLHDGGHQLAQLLVDPP